METAPKIKLQPGADVLKWIQYAVFNHPTAYYKESCRQRIIDEGCFGDFLGFVGLTGETTKIKRHNHEEVHELGHVTLLSRDESTYQRYYEVQSDYRVWFWEHVRVDDDSSISTDKYLDEEEIIALVAELEELKEYCS